MGQSGRHDAYPRLDAGRCLARVAAFAPDVDTHRMIEWLQSNDKTQSGAALWRDYTDSLRAHRRVERLREVVNATKKLPGQAARAHSQLVLLACEDRIDVGTEAYNSTDSVDPFSAILNVLLGRPVPPDVKIASPEPWFLRLKEYELYQYYDEIAESLCRLFFVFTANCLCERESENARLVEPFKDQEWIGQFIDCSAGAARKFAQRLKAREFVRYSWVFSEFSKVARPDFLVDRTGHGFAIPGRKAIFRLALDLHALQGSSYSPKIDAEDVEIVRRMPLFVLPTWLEITTAYRRTWFTTDGLESALTMVGSHLSSTVDDFGSRAELCGLAADLAASHGDGGGTAEWARKCWSNLVAYGYHKDVLLDQCLDAAECLQAAGWGADALDLLARLAPAVATVGDYTDGDETRYLPAELGRILFKGDLEWFVKYHEWLSASGEYWDAHSIFERFVADADLGNRVFRAVAETAVEHKNLLALAERSGRGDSNAEECLSRMPPFRVPSAEPKPERTSHAKHLRLIESGALPLADNFSPERLEAYLEACRAAGSYNESEDVDMWARSWSARGDKEAVLKALEAYEAGRSILWGDSRLRFELTLEVRGRQAAYKTLVVAQARRHGWSRYFSSSEEVRYVWTQLKELYPTQWLVFLQSTLMPVPDGIGRSGVTVRNYISRLIEYLLFIEQPEIAKRVAHAAVEATLQLVPLNLSPPTWIPGGTR